MFSKVFNPAYIKSLVSDKPVSREEILAFGDPEEFPKEASTPISLEQAARLIRRFVPQDWRWVNLATTLRRGHLWRNKLFLMPPLYISDGDPGHGGCLDHCIYCPWRHGIVPPEQLRRLTFQETLEETRHLINLGYGDIEIVAATDPVLLSGELASGFVSSAKAGGAKHVGVNFFPLKQPSDYHQLAVDGCDFAIVWQETYRQDVYKQLHPSGPKANFTYRLDAHDRALRGGIKTVGVAFLGGLTDWRFETLATIAHAQYLQKEYGANIIFGMPRWKPSPATQSQVAPAYYGDAEYEFVGMLYSLAAPSALPWFSTREHFDLSARGAAGGGCLFTLDCSTAVGGYTSTGGAPQFPVYSRSFKEGKEWLQKLGFDPQVHLPW